MADSNAHASRNLPIALVGGGMGVKGGRHIKYPADTPLANLHLRLLDTMGVRIDQLGHSTGRLPIEPLTGVIRDSHATCAATSLPSACHRAAGAAVAAGNGRRRRLRHLADSGGAERCDRSCPRARSGRRGRERGAGRWRDGVALGGPPIGPGGDRAADPRRRRRQSCQRARGDAALACQPERRCRHRRHAARRPAPIRTARLPRARRRS